MEKGEAIVQETRRFDQTTGKTSSMRRKENANDYRYFPDPDLAPIVTSDETISCRKAELPVRRRSQGEVHGGLWLDGVCGGAAGKRQGFGRIF